MHSGASSDCGAQHSYEIRGLERQQRFIIRTSDECQEIFPACRSSRHSDRRAFTRGSCNGCGSDGRDSGV